MNRSPRGESKARGRGICMDNRQTFGIIVSTRSFFPSHLVKEAREGIMGLLDRLGHGYVIVSETDTNLGAVMTYDDAKIAAGLFKKHSVIPYLERG